MALYLAHQNQLQALPNDRHPWPNSDFASFQCNPTVRQAHAQLIAAPYFGTPVITFNSYARLVHIYHKEISATVRCLNTIFLSSYSGTFPTA